VWGVVGYCADRVDILRYDGVGGEGGEGGILGV